ncbi:LOW QUALITY PROTEIN: probable phenylalanine--tRNA ligase, mitochondrial [Drosophila nasuta]|uniref:LOW QUALITY PROTEIN: probable phenylalanine--tRNA ligase, mitochondrial n=1 Tax=Drosophila nasuta TaxID=42062 RepID=UPI00295F30F9|nr:LOW QUALITY PROTEIN: probable phenylalanine--tRNA ligase, mitochondrial [Drosophila nasuta]
MKMLLTLRTVHSARICSRRLLASSAAEEASKIVTPNNQSQLEINGGTYATDSWTNVTPKILTHLGMNKHLQQDHPLSIIRQRIVNYFYAAYRNQRGNPLFSVYDKLNPVVTVQQNFDNLLIPSNHVSRQKSDCYYINEQHLLRAHTTAHQVELISGGLDNFLVVGEVYRRDEIDSTHYPVFHQADAVRLVTKDKLFERNPGLELFEETWTGSIANPKRILPSSKFMDQTKQPCHTLEAVKLMEHEMKHVLVGLTKDLFGPRIKYRWVDTYFPFTQPSWELEIYFKDNWLEVLGCGIMRHEILQHAGVHQSIGYAFGLGLERLAMILFDIPDIRLFWSNDSGFLSQFSEQDLQKLTKYKPISHYPQCTNDLSFWLPPDVEVNEGFSPNDFYDLVRSVAGDVVEQISLVDKFKHPKTGKSSVCFRIVYRHMERTMTQAEVNEIHKNIADASVEQFNVQIR